MLLHLMVLIEVRVGFGVYPFDRTVLKPLAAAAATLALELALDSHVAPTGLRIPLVIVAGLGLLPDDVGAAGPRPRGAAAGRGRARAAPHLEREA